MHRRDECCGLVSILVAASAWLVVGCAGGPELELRDTAELAARFGTIQEPMSGGACWVSPPGVPRFGAGNSWPNGEIIVRNQTQLVDAIRTVNDRGGAIYIQNNITVTEQLPTIKRNNVRISSRAEFVLYDAVAGGDRASEMFRVEGNNFVMRDVSIQGVGHRNPNNPGAWSGKRSAVAVVGNNAEIHRVYIRFFTHAAVRFEGGENHKVHQSTLNKQARSDLGYGVLLRNDARNVVISNNRMEYNSHAVATTGGRDQSYRAVNNWVAHQNKWHFDVHMGSDGWGGNKVEIYNNVAGDGALLLVRGPFRDGVYVERNLSNGTSGKLVQLKPDATFTTSGTTFQGGNFYSPFGLDADRARTFFSRGAIATNCSNQSYTAWW